VGGLIAASKALENPSGWRGVVLSGPFLQGAWKPTAWKLTMARLLSSVLPGFTTDSDFDPATVSRSPEVVAAYAADPLVTDKVSVRAATEILDAQVRTMRAASQLELPLLIMQAGEDKLSLPAASRRFYEAASSPDKTFKLYEGLYHEIFNEPEQDRVFADLIAWLDAHL
jgi:alpha-beta hydrolase superfamily lysophospholipase